MCSSPPCVDVPAAGVAALYALVAFSVGAD